MKEKDSMYVTCRCGIEFDLAKAPWCKCHTHFYTKQCPKGHCICHKLDKDPKQWRTATKEEKKLGFEIMLKEEHGGVKHG